MYTKSDAMQDKEREKQKKMKPWVDHIKAHFKGDERFMILQQYYRFENYKPVSAMLGSLSLLLQIPFFIAAYNYLSHLSLLEGASFLAITDLSKPDQLIALGGVSLNLLPILMTVFNIISGIIYTKGFPLKDKVQTYGLALIFLVLLYDSPSGLVLYWTLNNLFSLLKNVFMKLIKNSRAVLNVVAAAFGLIVFTYCAIFIGFSTRKKLVFMLGLVLVCFVPLISSFIKKILLRKNDIKKSRFIGIFDKNTNLIFNLSSVVLTLLLGAIIPLSVISAAPIEFKTITYSPFELFLTVFAVFAGIILLWVRIFYMMVSEKGKSYFALGMSFITILSVVDFFCFGRQLGTMSPTLVFDNELIFSKGIRIVGILTCIAILVLVMIVFAKKKIIITRLFQLGIIFFTGLTVFNSYQVITSVPIENQEESSYEKILPLSKNGKNVIVFMLDRAMGAYVPYFLEEKPELKEIYDGFTFYHNTVSYSAGTVTSGVALFGGYEYTPTKMNERSSELLVDKHNEALKMLPKLFSDNGYKVTVTDPPYAGYTWIPTLSIYDDLDGVNAYITKEKYADSENKIYAGTYVQTQKHNFVYYSILKSAPTALQAAIYNHGKYYSTSTEQDNVITESFINNYTVLTNLSNLTDISDDNQNNLLLIQNEVTHEPVLLQRPDYVPSNKITDPVLVGTSYEVDGIVCKMDNEYQISHYQTNMAALLRIGEWLSYLKAQGVYDNTRIIICSDHGRPLEQFDSLNWKTILDDDHIDGQTFTPLYMVKDFNAKGFTCSEEFMTVADTPTLAVEGLIDCPINPYTGKPINNDAKNEPQIVTSSFNWEADPTRTTFDTSDGYWYSVIGNIYDVNSWTRLEKGSK